MTTPPPIKLEPDLALEQRADAIGSVRCVIKQAGGGFNIIADRAEHTITGTAQKPTHQTSHMVVIDLSRFTFTARSAFSILRVQERVEFLDGDSVAKPQVTSAPRTELLQSIIIHRGCRAARAVRSDVVSARTSTDRACRFLGTRNYSTTTTAKPSSPIPLGKGPSAVGTLRLCSLRSTARPTTKALFSFRTSTKARKLLATTCAFHVLASVATKASSFQRPDKRLRTLGAFCECSHYLKISPGSDSEGARA